MSARQPHILVIEDDHLNGELYRQMLQRSGFEVIVTETGVHALDWLQLHQPDVVILDLLLPDISGFKILEYIRRNDRLRYIKIIITTASPRDELASTVNQADRVLIKPILPRELLQHIQQLTAVN